MKKIIIALAGASLLLLTGCWTRVPRTWRARRRWLMARTLSHTSPDEVYRVEVTVTKGDVSYTAHYGPYSKASTAQGVGTQRTRWQKNQGWTVKITVQRAVTTWEDVDA